MTKTDKVAELQEQLAQGVQDLTTSEGYRRWLDTASRFTRYSLYNQLLISLQKPDATQVAGFQTWKSLGRQVEKGQKGIAILAPMRQTVSLEDAATDEDKTVSRLRGFRPVHVFDLSQTSGAALPEPPVALLEGEAPDGLYDALAAQVEAAGLTLTREPIGGGANGFTDFQGKRVVVRDDVDDAQATKTLAHELAHVVLHEGVDYQAERDRWEVEAESVAYIVCNEAGLTTAQYSFGYIATWGTGKLDLVKDTAERVRGAAAGIVATRHRSLELSQELAAGQPVQVEPESEAQQAPTSEIAAPANDWEARVLATHQRVRASQTLELSSLSM